MLCLKKNKYIKLNQLKLQDISWRTGWFNPAIFPQTSCHSNRSTPLNPAKIWPIFIERDCQLTVLILPTTRCCCCCTSQQEALWQLFAWLSFLFFAFETLSTLGFLGLSRTAFAADFPKQSAFARAGNKPDQEGKKRSNNLAAARPRRFLRLLLLGCYSCLHFCLLFLWKKCKLVGVVAACHK